MSALWGLAANPLAPYAAAIKWAARALLALALLGLGAWGAYRWQAGEVAEARADRDAAVTERNGWKAAAEEALAAVAQQNASNAARMAALSAVMASAQAAEARADKAAEDFLRRREALERQHAQDLADPGCSLVMRRPICGAPLR